MVVLFYLGTHMPSWFSKTEVPLFVSRRKLSERKTFPRALGPWALDSGGFTELSMFGKWQTTPKVYVKDVARFSDEIGGMNWAAPMDWMCEPFMLEKTGLTVKDHQQRTVENLIELRSISDQPFIPVLQGWEYGDYLSHMDMYDAAGIDLLNEPLVGVGSVCRRQGTREAQAIITTVRALGINPHGFGVKVSGLRRYGLGLESADSMSWSYGARFDTPMAGHTHKNCANCLEYALAWREQIVRSTR